MSNAKSGYEELLQGVRNVLRKQGFKNRGDTFYVEVNGNWGLIDFQKSRSSNKDVVKFTINLGINSGKIRQFRGWLFSGLRPDIWRCHWQERIGSLLQKGDYWWSITSDSNDLCSGTGELFDEVEHVLNKYCIPQVQANIDDEKLLEQWIRGVSPGLTELERFIYLTALMKSYDHPLLRDTVMAMKIYALGQGFEGTVDKHIRKLNVQW